MHKDKKVDSVSFTLINNLVVIPVELNGVTLSFLLDIEVSETVLFGLNERDLLEIKNVQKITTRSLENLDSKEAYGVIITP